MDLPAILTAGLGKALGEKFLTAGLGEALGEKFLLGPDLTGCLCLSCSPSSQRGRLMLVRGSALQTKQLQLPVVASLI